MSTAKEKAKELVDKYRKYVDDGRHNGFYSGEITWNNQKKCAVITANEIISALDEHQWQNRFVIEFYNEVKQEIEKS
jgi:hypothetical protein